MIAYISHATFHPITIKDNRFSDLMFTLTDNNKKVTIVHVHNFLKMPFVRLYTNLSKDKLPAKFMTLLCQEMAPLLNKDPNLFNWIFETDKCMSKVSTYLLESYLNFLLDIQSKVQL